MDESYEYDDPVSEDPTWRRRKPLTGKALALSMLTHDRPSMTVSEGYVCIPIPTAQRPIHSYDIDLDHIKTPLKLIAWCRHLTAKPWMSAERLREFIDVVSAAQKFKVPHDLIR